MDSRTAVPRAALASQPRRLSSHARLSPPAPRPRPCPRAPPAMPPSEAVPALGELRPVEGGRGRGRERGGVVSLHSSLSSGTASEGESKVVAAGWRAKVSKLRVLGPARPGVARGAGGARRRAGQPGLPALAAMERKGERCAGPLPHPLPHLPPIPGGTGAPPSPRRARISSRLSPLLSLSAGAAGPKEADQSQEGQGPEEVSAAPGSPQAAAPATGAASRRRLFVTAALPRGEGAAEPRGAPSSGGSRALPRRRSVRTPRARRVFNASLIEGTFRGIGRQPARLVARGGGFCRPGSLPGLVFLGI